MTQEQQPQKKRAGWSRRRGADRPKPITLESLWDGFFYQLRVKRRSKNTLDFYAVTQRKLDVFASEYPQWPGDMRDVTVVHLRAFASWLERGGIGPGGLHAHVRAVKALFTWAYREEIMPHNPSDRLSRPNLPKKGLPSVTPEQATAMMRAARETDQPLRDLAMVRVLYDTGLRVSELCALTVDDLNPGKGLIQVRAGKGEKDRAVPLGSRGFTALTAYLRKERDPLHEGVVAVFLARTGRPLTTSGVANRLSMIAADAGLTRHDTSPHAFRRGFAVEYLRNGGDVFTLQNIMGHTTLDMTRKYVQFLDEDLKTAHLRFSPGDKLTGR